METEIEEIRRRWEMGYTASLYGSPEEARRQIRLDLDKMVKLTACKIQDSLDRENLGTLDE